MSDRISAEARDVKSESSLDKVGTYFNGRPEETRALGTFIKLLRAAHWVSLKAGSRREAAQLTESQFGVLEALHHRGPLKQAELATKLLSSTSNLTLVLDNLERDGLVERRVHQRDRRSHLVHLTAKGRDVIVALFPEHVERIVEIMNALNADELKRLGVLCRKLGRTAAEID